MSLDLSKDASYIEKRQAVAEQKHYNDYMTKLENKQREKELEKKTEKLLTEDVWNRSSDIKARLSRKARRVKKPVSLAPLDSETTDSLQLRRDRMGTIQHQPPVRIVPGYMERKMSAIQPDFCVDINIADGNGLILTDSNQTVQKGREPVIEYEDGVVKTDIELVMDQTDTTWDVAKAALQKHNGDIVNAIMDLSA